MPLYDIEVIHTIKYKKRIEAASADEVNDKANELWIDRKETPADEDVQLFINEVEPDEVSDVSS